MKTLGTRKTADQREEACLASLNAEENLEERGEYQDLLAMRLTAWENAAQNFKRAVDATAKTELTEEHLLRLYTRRLLDDVQRDIKLLQRDEDFVMQNTRLLCDISHLGKRNADTVDAHMREMASRARRGELEFSVGNDGVMGAARETTRACRRLMEVLEKRNQFLERTRGVQ